MERLKWYVITGGPSSGKTSVINELKKLGYTTIPEAARLIIDREMRKGKSIEEIRRNEVKFQLKVWRLKLFLEQRAPRNEILFLDRGLPDSIAYFKLLKFKEDEIGEIIETCKRRKYEKVFFLEQLPFEKDYARTEDEVTAKKLSELIFDVYSNLGYEVIKVPRESVRKRVELILSHIDSQKELAEAYPQKV